MDGGETPTDTPRRYHVQEWVGVPAATFVPDGYLFSVLLCVCAWLGGVFLCVHQSLEHSNQKRAETQHAPTHTHPSNGVVLP